MLRKRNRKITICNVIHQSSFIQSVAVVDGMDLNLIHGLDAFQEQNLFLAEKCAAKVMQSSI